MFAKYSVAAPTFAANDPIPLQADVNGNLKVVIAAAGTLPTGAATAAKQDSQTTLLAGGLPAALAQGGGLKVEPATGDYETVAASQTDQMLGATGAVGDRLDALLVIPATLNPGAISIEQGNTNTTVFAGGTGSVTSLAPFLIVFGTCGIAAAGAGWEITTGADVSCIAFGQFT